jgi:tetratricopeptide (TPR) repeat protein
MKNRHPFSTAMFLAALLGLTVTCAVQAQSVQSLEWQPSQSSVPTVQSTPHNDVRKLLRQGKYEQALVLVNRDLSTNPRDPQMRFWQGYIYEQLGQPTLAQQVYLALTQEYPELAEPHNNLGVLYATQGNYQGAMASIEAALRANPNYAIAHENLGDVLLNLANQSYTRAQALDSKQSRLTQKIERLRPSLALTQDKP